MLGAGGAKKKPYMEDVFSTYIYDGNSSTNVINNGINLSGEGGLVWAKVRNGPYNYNLYDTVRGTAQPIYSSATNAASNQANGMNSFNSNGFTLGSDSNLNESTKNYSSWTFRKAPGFFDIVTYEGNGTARTIAHNLGCVPAAIWIKDIDSTESWACYHKETGPNYITFLNSDTQGGTGNDPWNSTAPTSTHFSVKTDGQVNGNGNTFIAYLFAGGDSTAATARSVDFDGTGDYLSISDHADFHFGNGNFCVELWIKGTANNSNRNIIGQWAAGQMGWSVYWAASNQGHSAWGFKYSTTGSNEIQVSDILLDDDQWHHIAVVRDGNDVKLYRDGKYRTKLDVTDVTFNDSSAELRIANDGWNSPLDCHISNVRVVKGSSVYTTTTYRIPTEPLTNITNTKLLCCNGTSTTSSTVTPGTITANGDPTSSTVTPFDDPAGFVFGENEDQNIIKCGSYVGNGDTTNGTEINLGFEPQWLLIKSVGSLTEHWHQFDSMRGMTTGDKDIRLEINQSTAETTSVDFLNINPDGFTATYSPNINKDGEKYVYLAIRRPDGYCGKPAKLGTDVFAMDYGSGSTAIPEFDSNFPVDFATYRIPTSTDNWFTGARLTGTGYMRLHDTHVEAADGDTVFDSNVGYNKNQATDRLAWMWKRHAGFDVVTYTGNADASGAVTRQDIPHSLGKTPEMIWAKRRNSTADWYVYHKGFNGGVNPQNYVMYVNESDSEGNGATIWNQTAPTANCFTVGGAYAINKEDDTFIAMLFASTDVSKCGYYTGNGSTGQTITTGFQPRFLIIKKTSGAQNWLTLDTTRGWGSGNENFLKLNNTDAQAAHDFGAPTSTGFTLTSAGTGYNDTDEKYIYYAHA